MVILDEKSCDKGSYESYKIIQKISRAHERAVIGVAYVQDTDSQQEYLVTCAQESLKIWLVDANDPGLLIEKLEIKEWRSGVQDFDVTSDGKMIAVVGTDSTIHIYKLSFSDYSHTSETFYEGFMQQWFVKIAPKATHLVTVNFSGLIMVVSTSGKVQGSFNFNEARQISSLTYSPDGQSIAIATNEGIVTIVSVATLETRFYFEGSHAIKVRAVCFSPTSDHLLTGSDDKIVKLHMISANKAQLVRSFCGHRSCVTMVKYHSQDPKMFASSSNDGCVIVWSTTQHHPLHIFQGDHEGVIRSFSFSLDGSHIASVGEDRAITIHKLNYEKCSGKSTIGLARTMNKEFEVDGSQQRKNGMAIGENSTVDGLTVESKIDDDVLIRARRDFDAVTGENIS